MPKKAWIVVTRLVPTSKEEALRAHRAVKLEGNRWRISCAEAEIFTGKTKLSQTHHFAASRNVNDTHQLEGVRASL
jgi:hypothetical protein